MAEFTRMGEHLPDTKPPNDTESSSSSTAEPDPLLSLQALRPTAEYEHMLADAQLDMAALENLIADMSKQVSQGDHVELAGQKLKEALHRRIILTEVIDRFGVIMFQAIKRDELQATRPDGCWCLGAGATGERYVPDLQGGGIAVRTDYCSCPEGIAARAEDDRIRDAYRRGIRRARLDRYFGSSRVPPRYASVDFDSYPAMDTTAPIVERLRGYAASCGQAEGSSIMLWGEYGTGKTGLAISTMRAAIEAHGLDAFFATVPDLLNEIRSTFSPARTVRLPYADDGETGTPMTSGQLQRLVRETSLLVLDDLGAERVTEWVEEALFALINHRHNRMLRTIFTSNLSTTELAEHLGERTVWRIVAMCDVIHLDGPNLRVSHE